MSRAPADPATPQAPEPYFVERTQTGVRIQKNLLKVLKGLAEYLDISLGDLLEGIVLHAFEGKPPFDPQIQERIAQLKEIYGLTLDASASHRLVEVRHAHGHAEPAKSATPRRRRGENAGSP